MRSERGQLLPLVALACVVLLGLAAFGIDVGHAYVVKRQLQSAVDSAALAGAYDLPNTATATTAAGGYAAANTPANTGMTYGYTVQAGVLSVVGNATTDTWFARIVGLDHFHVTAHANAIATPAGGRLVDDGYVIPTPPPYVATITGCPTQVSCTFTFTRPAGGPVMFTVWCNTSATCTPNQFLAPGSGGFAAGQTTASGSITPRRNIPCRFTTTTNGSTFVPSTPVTTTASC